MIDPASLHKPYLFVKWNRIRKKWSMSKMALRMMIDWTIAIYSIVLFGYVFASIFILGDTLEQFSHLFDHIELIALERVGLVMTILPIVNTAKSFKDPGISFTSSEHTLSILAFDRKNIWLLAILEKTVKNIFVIILIGLFLILISPFHWKTILIYLSMLIFIDIAMIIPQWKLFQKSLLIKLLLISTIPMFNIFHLFLSSKLMIIITVGILILSNVILYRRALDNVLWDQVLAESDFRVWNMRWISLATGIKFKRQKKYGFIHKTVFPKQPFTYTNLAIQHKLWQVYFTKQLQIVFKINGSMFLLLCILFFVPDYIFYFAIAVVIHIFTSASASFFKDHFDSDIVQVLPWDLSSYKQSFFKWAASGFLILLVPIIYFLITHITFWSPFQLLFYVCTFLFLYHVKLEKASAILEKSSKSFQTLEAVSILLLILICLTGAFPIISLVSFIFLIIKAKTLTKKLKK